MIKALPDCPIIRWPAFHPQAYAPSRDYDGRFGQFDFRRHFYGRMGDFDSKEEFECACWLDTQAQKGRMQFWVRNLVRREGSAFFLQKAQGRWPPRKHWHEFPTA